MEFRSEGFGVRGRGLEFRSEGFGAGDWGMEFRGEGLGVRGSCLGLWSEG